MSSRFFSTQPTRSQQQNDDNPAHNFGQATTQQTRETRHNATQRNATKHTTGTPRHTTSTPLAHLHFQRRYRPTSFQLARGLHKKPQTKFFLRDASNSPNNECAKVHAPWYSGKVRALRTEREPTERVIIGIVIERNRHDKRRKKEERETCEKRERAELPTSCQSISDAVAGANGGLDDMCAPPVQRDLLGRCPNDAQDHETTCTFLSPTDLAELIGRVDNTSVCHTPICFVSSTCGCSVTVCLSLVMDAFLSICLGSLL